MSLCDTIPTKESLELTTSEMYQVSKIYPKRLSMVSILRISARTSSGRSGSSISQQFSALDHAESCVNCERGSSDLRMV